MSAGDAQPGPAAMSAAEQRWYADFVMHCMEATDATDAAAVLASLDKRPFNECLHMRGDADLDGRYEDSAHQLWSHDRYGRWFTTEGRKIVWLQRRLARLRYRREPHADEVVSHICGNCGCIRLQHLKYQSRGEDKRDSQHHRSFGSGLIRSVHLPPNEEPPTAGPTPPTSHRPRSAEIEL